MKQPWPYYQAQWMMCGKRFVGPATGYSLGGPASGTVGTPSAPFTVSLTPNGGTVAGTVTVTPSDSGAGGTFTPSTVSLTTVAPSASFTYTAASAGTKTISCSDSGGLNDPAGLSYAAAAAGLVDGNPVSTWADSSGNGHNATQTGSARPIFKTAILNGKPIVRFTSAGLSGLNFTPTISGALNFTIIAVMKQAASGSSLYAIAGDQPGPMLVAVGTTTYGEDQAAYWSSLSPSVAFHVFTIDTQQGVASHTYFDGANQSVTPTILANTGDFKTLGYRLTPGYSDGDIAEIIYYTGVLSGTDRANVEKYLGTKYGITVAGGTAADPSTVAGLVAWWKADSLG